MTCTCGPGDACKRCGGRKPLPEPGRAPIGRVAREQTIKPTSPRSVAALDDQDAQA